MNYDNETIYLINKYQLMIRPTLGNNWIAGRWKGVTLDSKAYCFAKEESESETIGAAVRAVVQIIEAT